jgi:putative ABC transport system permease protein
MNKLNLIKSAITTIKQNKFRTFLTMLGIIIGVTSVIIMLAIGEGSKKSIQDSISSMGSNMLMVHPGSEQQGGMRLDRSLSQTLKLSDYEALKNKSTYLKYISPSVQGSGRVIYGNTNWPTSIIGFNTDGFAIRKYEIKEGTAFTERDVQTAAKSIIIGQTVVENLFPNGEDPIGKVIRFNKIPFTVVGVLKEKGSNTFGQDQDDIVIAPYTTVQKRILAITYLNEIIMSSTSENTSDAATAEIEQILRESHKLKPGTVNDFSVRSQQELITTISSTSEMMTVLLVTIAAFSLLVGGIGIMNIMYVSVKERTREIGLRLSVGAKGRDILKQFLLEAVLISVTGGVIGLLLGLGGSWVVSNYLGWPVLITGISIVISFAVCSFTGIFFGLYPAYKASKLDPIVALRYE